MCTGGYPKLWCTLYSYLFNMLQYFRRVGMLVFNKQRNHENFFKWKLVDRLSFYTAVCDLLFYVAKLPLIIRGPLDTTNYPIFRILVSACTVLFMEFAYARVVMSFVVAVGVLLLMMKNKGLSLGNRDWRLHFPVFGLPLIVLAIFQTVSILTMEHG